MNIQRNTERYANSCRRGTVLIFVVAVLSLLVVMGTAFLLMSRQERGSSRSTSDVVNMDWGRDAALNQVRQLIFDYQSVNPGSTGGALLDQPAAWQPAPSGVSNNYVVGNVVMGSDGRAYSCSHIHTSSTTVANMGPPFYSSSGVASASINPGGNWALYAGTTLRSRNFDYPNPGNVTTNWADSTDSSVLGQPWLGAGEL